MSQLPSQYSGIFGDVNTPLTKEQIMQINYILDMLVSRRWHFNSENGKILTSDGVLICELDTKNSLTRFGLEPISIDDFDNYAICYQKKVIFGFNNNYATNQIGNFIALSPEIVKRLLDHIEILQKRIDYLTKLMGLNGEEASKITDMCEDILEE